MRGQLKNTGVIDPSKVTMHVQTEVVYSDADRYYHANKRRHAGLRCPSETDLSSVGNSTPGTIDRFKHVDVEMDSLNGNSSRLFWSNR